MNDVFALAKELARSGQEKPAIFTSIGTKDPHWDENIRLRTLLIKHDYDVHWEQGPFIHDWVNWNHYIELALQWVAKRRSGVDETLAW